MSNGSLPWNDQTPVPRASQGRYVWVKLFGRDWVVVKRHKPTLLGVIGATTGSMGVVGLAWGSMGRFRPDLIGITLIVVSAIVVCYGRLKQRNLAADEIYKVAYDRGREDGYDEGYEDRGMERPERPVVVEFPGQCEHRTKPHVVTVGAD